MNDQPDTFSAISKIIIAWLGAAFGGLTLNRAALVATLVFTVLQIYILLRDRLFRKDQS